jgi:urease accessory protein
MMRTNETSAAAGGVEPAALYRLMAWLSPAYPVGAFSYSGGIEWAVEAGDVTDAATLARWLAAMIAQGSASRERFLETTAQGRAFFDTTRAAWPCAALDRLAAAWNGPLAYPVAVGAAAAGHGVAVEPALAAFLQAIAGNLVSAALRLVRLGQTDGQRVLAGLEPVIADCAQRALACPLEEIGGAAFRADLAGMHHETQYTRLFRS